MQSIQDRTAQNASCCLDIGVSMDVAVVHQVC